MEKPLVSVIMPVYNGEKYIGKAIESVLAQNVPTELLVIDDCSTDKTELTVMKYMDSGNQWFFHKNDLPFLYLQNARQNQPDTHFLISYYFLFIL